MFPRRASPIRQSFASVQTGAQTGFASTRGLRHSGLVACLPRFGACGSRDCYPFPSTWPGPLRVGPFFCRAAARRAVADPVNALIFGFAFARDALDSGGITKTNRGSSKCGNPSFSSLFSPCRSQAACKTPRRAGLPVRQRALSWPTPPTTTRLPVPSSAVWPGLLRAACQRRSAVSRAIRATDPRAASAATASAQSGSVGRIARLAPFLFAQSQFGGRCCRPKGRAPCSRKF